MSPGSTLEFFLVCTLKLVLKKAMFGIFNILLVIYCIQLVVMSIQLHILESNLTLPRWQVVSEDHLVSIPNSGKARLVRPSLEIFNSQKFFHRQNI